MPWVDVPGFAGLYEASDEGAIRSVSRLVPCKGGTRRIKSRLLKQSYDNDGYAVVSLSSGDGSQKSFRWHRIILLAFKGPCPVGMEGRHLDDVRKHNALRNLEWGTPRENWNDRKLHGRGVEGMKNPNYGKGKNQCSK